MCSQLWIAKHFFKHRKPFLTCKSSCDFSICFLYFAAYSDTLHCPFQPRDTGVAAAPQRCSDIQLGWKEMVIPFSLCYFAAGYMPHARGLYLALMLGITQRHQLEGGRKDTEWQLLKGMTIKMTIQATPCKKINFLLLTHTLADSTVNPQGWWEWNIYSTNPSSAEVGTNSPSAMSAPKCKVEHEAPGTSHIKVCHPQALDI